MSEYHSATRSRPDDARRPRQVTARFVFVCLAGFFAVVFAVNALMVYAALSTFGGVETASAYQAGRRFERDVALAEAQDARRWQVNARVTPAQDGTARLDIVARDAAGLPLDDIEASAVFERPTDRRLDRAVAVAEDAPGRFHGSAEVAKGQWDLVIELSRQGERLFRSKNRLVLR